MGASWWWLPLTVGLVVLAVALTLWIERTRMRRRRMVFARWQIALDEDVRELLDAHLHVADCQMRLALLMKEVPVEFVPPLVEAMRLGEAIPRALMKSARARGLVGAWDLDLGRVAAERAPEPETPALEEAPAARPPIAWATDGRPVPRRKKAS